VTSRSSSDRKQLPPQKKVRLILQRLGETTERPAHATRLAPMDSLVLTILSQNTNDRNSGRAFEQLKARFATWGEVLDAPAEELARTIHSAGLENIKSGRIQEVLGRIAADRGELDLEFLRALPPPEAHDYLLSLPGIGRKTAAVVLLFTFDLPFFPVDTHVLRVSKRLGLIPPQVDADRAHDLYGEMLKPEQMLPLHLALIWHGRRVCAAQRPRCDACVLLDLCPQAGVAS
jgi:endonuclease III